MKKNSTIVNKIADYLRYEITNSKIDSSKHIKESDIAKKFNVSRVPVREAFRIVQSEGYIETIPHRGSFVKKISRDYIKQTAIVHKILAPLVLEHAIPNYKKTTYKKADEILNEISRCEDFSKIGYMLWDFAKTIYGPSKKKFMLELFDEIYLHNMRLLNEIASSMPDKYDITSHRKFIELCREEKKDEAISVWKKHINKVEKISLTRKVRKKILN